MTTLLSYASLGGFLLLQNILMWRLDRGTGRDRCSFYAGLISVICLSLHLLIIRLFPGGAEMIKSQHGLWLFLGSYFAYQGSGFAGEKVSLKFTRWELYSWLVLFGFIGVMLLVSKLQHAW